MAKKHTLEVSSRTAGDASCVDPEVLSLASEYEGRIPLDAEVELRRVCEIAIRVADNPELAACFKIETASEAIEDLLVPMIDRDHPELPFCAHVERLVLRPGLDDASPDRELVRKAQTLKEKLDVKSEHFALDGILLTRPLEQTGDRAIYEHIEKHFRQSEKAPHFLGANFGLIPGEINGKAADSPESLLHLIDYVSSATHSPLATGCKERVQKAVCGLLPSEANGVWKHLICKGWYGELRELFVPSQLFKRVEPEQRAQCYQDSQSDIQELIIGTIPELYQAGAELIELIKVILRSSGRPSWVERLPEYVPLEQLLELYKEFPYTFSVSAIINVISQRQTEIIPIVRGINELLAGVSKEDLRPLSVLLRESVPDEPLKELYKECPIFILGLDSSNIEFLHDEISLVIDSVDKNIIDPVIRLLILVLINKSECLHAFMRALDDITADCNKYWCRCPHLGEVADTIQWIPLNVWFDVLSKESLIGVSGLKYVQQLNESKRLRAANRFWDKTDKIVLSPKVLANLPNLGNIFYCKSPSEEEMAQLGPHERVNILSMDGTDESFAKAAVVIAELRPDNAVLLLANLIKTCSPCWFKEILNTYLSDPFSFEMARMFCKAICSRWSRTSICSEELDEDIFSHLVNIYRICVNCQIVSDLESPTHFFIEGTSIDQKDVLPILGASAGILVSRANFDLEKAMCSLFDISRMRICQRDSLSMKRQDTLLFRSFYCRLTPKIKEQYDSMYKYSPCVESSYYPSISADQTKYLFLIDLAYCVEGIVKYLLSLSEEAPIWAEDAVKRLMASIKGELLGRLKALLEPGAPAKIEEIIDALGDRFPSRPCLEKMGVDTRLLDKVSDEHTKGFLGKAIEHWLISDRRHWVKRQPTTVLAHLIEGAIKAYIDQPAVLARAILGALKQLNSEFNPDRLKGLLRAFGFLREAVGGKVPKRLAEIRVQEDISDSVREVAEAQHRLFGRDEIKKGCYRKAERRTKEAYAALIRADENSSPRD